MSQSNKSIVREFYDLAFNQNFKRMVAEADLVAVHCHLMRTPGERGMAVMDLFRVEAGKVVEHWDVMQEVPETCANPNGMF